jgi:hypothetical protein
MFFFSSLEEEENFLAWGRRPRWAWSSRSTPWWASQTPGPWPWPWPLTNAAARAWVAWLVGATVVFMEILGAGMAAGDMGN